MKRDPRKNPRTGDVLIPSAKRLFSRRYRYSREVLLVMNSAVRYYQDGPTGLWLHDCLLKSWRRWAKYAEVAHASE